jgi:hypothetical protein
MPEPRTLLLFLPAALLVLILPGPAILIIQQWLDLSAPRAKDESCRSEAKRRFAWINFNETGEHHDEAH